MSIGSLVRYAGLAAAVAVTASCGDVVRSNDAPVMLKVNSLGGGTTGSGTVLSDVVRNVTTPLPCTVAVPCPTPFNDPGTATLAVLMKDVTSLVAPSSNNSVTVNRYRVEYRRADGHNTPGVDVPYPFDGAVTATIAANSTTSVGFQLVRHVAKLESPLVELSFNGNIIGTIADVTFFGADQVGNDVSATGSILIEFANFGD